MKTLTLFIASVVFFTNTKAQVTTPTIVTHVTSTPTSTTTVVTQLKNDQNPNFQKSKDKYTTQTENLTKTQGTTIQETYKAIDDVAAKAEQRKLNEERRYNKRMAQIQANRRNNNRYNNINHNNGYNNGYFSNGCNNNGYNNTYYNNGYYNNGYNGYFNNYNNNPYWVR